MLAFPLDDTQIESIFRPSRRIPADDAEFEAFMDAENERLDGLFFESQKIVRENPDWLRNPILSKSESATLEMIARTEAYPVTCKGHVVRTERVPSPEIADGFIRWTIHNVNKVHEERELNQVLRVDVPLFAESLRNEVSRKFMSFSDFDRNARTGQPESTNPDNVRIFLKMLRLELRWNVWWQRQEIGEVKDGKEHPDRWVPVDDATLGRFMTQAGDTQYAFRPAEALFRRTVETIARENTYDPVLEYLAEREAQWDGTPRLGTWLSVACGVPCDPYHQAVGKNLIGGMVKRARRPAAKHDEVVILMGPQGTFKSTLCQVLAWKPEFFTDSVAFDGSPQNIVPQLFGKWLIELSELDGMAGRETSFLKRFISSTTDTVTLKYKALSSDYARRCVFVGTTNDDRVLRDATGNRRFLPVRIDRHINIEWVRENLDQLFAEAAVLESAGANFAIPSEAHAAATVAQESARSESDFETYLETWFGGEGATLVTAADVASLLRDATGKSIQASRYGAVMKRLGFADERTYIAKKQTRVWLRGTEQLAQRVRLSRDASGRLSPQVFDIPPASVGANVVSMPTVRHGPA